MPDKRVTVWIQRFSDRPALMLQRIDPDTGRRKSRTAGTADEKEAEKARADLEYELNHGRYQEASRMSWERFRELFEAEYLPNCRPTTSKAFLNVFRLLEEVCAPRTIRGITERTISTFAAGLRRMPGRLSREGRAASSIKVVLSYLHAALTWATEQKIIPECPGLPPVKVAKKRPQPVAAESFERLLSFADRQMRAYLLCGCWPGFGATRPFCWN